MRVLIISDTHGREENLLQVLEKDGKPDRILHMGDLEASEAELELLAGCPVTAVCGNCDFFTNLPKTRFLEIGKEKIMMTHGHCYFVAAGLFDLMKEARTNNCSVVMFGHTHRPVIDTADPDLTVINPGSLSFPRQENHQPSYIWMTINEKGKTEYSLRYLETGTKQNSSE